MFENKQPDSTAGFGKGRMLDMVPSMRFAKDFALPISIGVVGTVWQGWGVMSNAYSLYMAGLSHDAWFLIGYVIVFVAFVVALQTVANRNSQPQALHPVVPDSVIDPVAADAKAVPAGARPRLAAAERERAAEALCDIADFAGTDLMEFYQSLSNACVNPQVTIASAEGLDTQLACVADQLNTLGNKHYHSLSLMDFDVRPLIDTLSELTRHLRNVGPARDWPPQAQADRVQPILQSMSDVGGWVYNLRDWAVEKRREYLE